MLLHISLTALVAMAVAQCGPDKSKPYPAGSSTCPSEPPSGGGTSGGSSGQPPSGGGTSGGSSGGTSGAACDGTGASATYTETIDSTGATPSRKISSAGCPNHYSLCTGKDGVTGCGAIGSQGTASEAKDQSKSLSLPASPVLRSSFGIGVSGSDVGCELGATAIALNGVSIYGGAVDTSCTPIDPDSISSEWSSFDCCSGHSERSGDYHYHFPPSCLLQQIGDLSDGHSPQIGWSFDGFPIYGPKGPGGIDMKYGGSYGSCTGTYCLDACGGLELELPAVDKFKYRYYLVGATSDLSTIPGNPKPSTSASAVLPNGRASFTINCYRGFTYTELTGGSTGTSGVAAGYTAEAATGVTTKFAPSGLCSGSGITSGSGNNGFCSDFTSSSCNSAYAGVGASSSTNPSPSPSPSPSPAPSPSPSPSPSPAPPAQSPSPSQSPSPAPSPSPLPAQSPSPSQSPSPAPSPSPLPAQSPSLSPSPSPTPLPSPTQAADPGTAADAGLNLKAEICLFIASVAVIIA